MFCKVDVGFIRTVLVHNNRLISIISQIPLKLVVAGTTSNIIFFSSFLFFLCFYPALSMFLIEEGMEWKNIIFAEVYWSIPKPSDSIQASKRKIQYPALRYQQGRISNPTCILAYPSKPSTKRDENSIEKGFQSSKFCSRMVTILTILGWWPISFLKLWLVQI